MALMAENVVRDLVAKFGSLPANQCPLVAFGLRIAKRPRKRPVPVFHDAPVSIPADTDPCKWIGDAGC